MVDPSTTPQPTHRVVILGASNVALGLSTVIDTARRAWGEPLEVLAAIGHGRSYGMTTNLLGRRLPGILQCGIWEALQNRPALPTAALVTDIGNDIIYGCSVGPIARWLEKCLQRLSPQTERLVVSRLPIEVVSTVPEWKIRLLTSLVFPSSRLNYDTALESAIDLDDRLLDFADRFGAYVVQPDSQWYTWDPIHIARRHRRVAWQKYMTWWANGQPPTQAHRSLRQWITLQRARPLAWHRFGFARHCDQPTVKLSDGTTISLF